MLPVSKGIARSLAGSFILALSVASRRARSSLVVACSLMIAGALAPGVSVGATIDSVEICVSSEQFEFQVALTEPDGEVIFRIGADSDPFVTPNERIAVNFDAVTGDVTRQDPEVQTFGTPPLDRWVDGPISDFDITAGGSAGEWVVSGSVPNGADAFRPNDELWGVAVRSGGTTFSGPVNVPACEVEPAIVSIPFQGKEPTLDGRIGYGEWPQQPQLQLDNGSVTVVHDRIRIYFLFNMRDDRSDNAFRDGGPDQLWMLFDVDEDEAKTPGLDRRYRMLTGTGNFRYETYAAPGGFPFNPPSDRTFSGLGEGFGCFLADGSATIFPEFSCDRHRVWEVGIDIREVFAADDKSARLGLLVQSELDEFQTVPVDLNRFADFIRLDLTGETSHSLPRTPDESFDSSEFRVTQAVQNTANDLPLVDGRETWVDLRFLDTDDDVIATVFASRNGVDLPGSPFAKWVRSTYSQDRDPRSQGSWRFELGPEYARGDVEFQLVAREPNLQTTAAGPAQTVRFLETREPTYWIVPINRGSSSEPDLPGENFLTRSELEVEASFPVRSVDFVRRPAIVEDPSDDEDVIDVLNQHDQQAVLAWTIGLLLTGESPFQLPDQIIGALPASWSGSFIGLSDPKWLSGAARVVWIEDVDDDQGLLLSHELNHNLDTSTSGTWGRHVPFGCGATGPDPQWPHGNDDIQVPALVTRPVIDDDGAMPRLPTRKDADTPDYMSYCSDTFDEVVPFQWVSAYRWRNQILNVFALQPVSVQALRSGPSIPMLSSPADMEAFYVTGRLLQDGGAELDPVLRQPGFPRADLPPGDYAIRLVSCDGGTLYAESFGAQFVNVEGAPRDSVPLSFVLPDPGGVCAIRLLRQETVLAEREVTPNIPQVSLLTPNGGESWSGAETVAWEAIDLDGDSLTASLLYSPDGGASWLPVAGGIAGQSQIVDSTVLPGSESARLRVIVTDGVNTVHDDSDGVFTVEEKAPTVTILLPRDGAYVDGGESFLMRGAAREPQGTNLSTESFRWFANGAGVGMGNPVTVSLPPGSHDIVLQATGPNGLTGQAEATITVLEATGLSDSPGDVESDGLDLVALNTSMTGDRFACELIVASGDSGLVRRGQYSCQLDFDEPESEAFHGCDADGDGLLDDTYRLGTNRGCPVTDVGLNYRFARNGGRCTGPGSVSCRTIEVGATGGTDQVCDGDVGGEAARECRIVLSTDVGSLVEARAQECSAGGCPEPDGGWPAFLVTTAHFRGDRDRLPDTEGEEPNTQAEALEVRLPSP